MSVTPIPEIESDVDLVLAPVGKHNWKTTAGRDHWRSSLVDTRRAYALVEIEAVLSAQSPRRAAIVGLSGISLDEILRATTGRSVALRTIENDGAIIVAEDEDTAAEMVAAYHMGDSDTLGELLGYPECCVDAYTNGDEQAPPMYEIACNTECAEPIEGDDSQVLIPENDGMLNIMWAYMGWKFISHVPCSFDCHASHETAVTHGKLYRELGYDDEAELLWEFLSENTQWTGRSGLSNIRNGYCIGSTNTPDYLTEVRNKPRKVVLGGKHSPQSM